MLDIDGRIHCGIVGRLRVPHTFTTRLRRVCAWKLYLNVSSDWFTINSPWQTCLSDLEWSSPQDWLDRWYTQELPRLFQEPCWDSYKSEKTQTLLMGAF